MVDKPTIEKSTMDGTTHITLVQFKDGRPGDLAIDHINSRLYWIDYVKRKIESVNFLGALSLLCLALLPNLLNGFCEV